MVLPSAVNPSDASATVNWGFIELTFLKEKLFANLSYVDFVGLVLGIKLEVAGQLDGSATQIAQGLPNDALKPICDALAAQTKVDGHEWSKLCLSDNNGRLLRVLCPSEYISFDNKSFSTLWTPYIDRVWSHYAAQALTIDTQSAAGKIACQISDDQLHCTGSSFTYSKPSAVDIFGCNSGPFNITDSANDVHKAIVPCLCAAFHRSTPLLNEGNVQPSLPASSYYGDGVTNWYSKIVHQFESDGRGYAFPYDDVNPSGGKDVSGTVASAKPGVLKVFVGGPA